MYGEMDQDKIFEREYYVPYFEGTGITTYADVLVERRIAKRDVCRNLRGCKSGSKYYFPYTNAIEYMKEKQLGGLAKRTTSVTLSGLGSSGMILFPISKDEHLEKTRKEEERNRMMLLSAARSGDQEAMETLTLDDIDTYSKVSKRLITEDIFYDCRDIFHAVWCGMRRVFDFGRNHRLAQNTEQSNAGNALHNDIGCE